MCATDNQCTGPSGWETPSTAPPAWRHPLAGSVLEQPTQPAPRRGLSRLVAGAATIGGHPCHHLIDVHPATAPGHVAASAARCRLAHHSSFRSGYPAGYTPHIACAGTGHQAFTAVCARPTRPHPDRDRQGSAAATAERGRSPPRCVDVTEEGAQKSSPLSGYWRRATKPRNSPAITTTTAMISAVRTPEEPQARGGRTHKRSAALTVPHLVEAGSATGRPRSRHRCRRCRRCHRSRRLRRLRSHRLRQRRSAGSVRRRRRRRP